MDEDGDNTRGIGLGMNAYLKDQREQAERLAESLGLNCRIDFQTFEITKKIVEETEESGILDILVFHASPDHDQNPNDNLPDRPFNHRYSRLKKSAEEAYRYKK